MARGSWSWLSGNGDSSPQRKQRQAARRRKDRKIFFEALEERRVLAIDFASAGLNVPSGSSDPTAAADFNGDGIADLATPTGFTNSVTVSLLNADGSVQSTFDQPVGTAPTFVVAADFNADGKADLAVANLASNNVSILRGMGDGSFAAPTNYQVGISPIALATGDFDADGGTDLAVANFSSGTVSVLRGQGDGSFALGKTLTVGSRPISLLTGDWNNDGKRDLAVGVIGSASSYVLYNTSTSIAATSDGTNLTISSTSAPGQVKNLSVDFTGGTVKIAAGEAFSSAPAGWTVAKDGTLQAPASAFSGSINITGGAGDDTLVVNLVDGQTIPTINYEGGAGGFDTLVINGGSQRSVTFNFTNATDGNVVMSEAGVVNYTGLEPVSYSGPTDDIVFNLPTSGNVQALLEDSATAGMQWLRSVPFNVAFESIEFPNPTNSLTINRGSATDDLTVTGIPDFTAGLTLGSALNPFETIDFAGAMTLAVNKSLSANASGAISLSTTDSDLATSGTGTVSFASAQNISLANGASVQTANAAITLIADAMSLLGVVNAGTSSVTLKPSTAGFAVNLGGADSATELGLTAAEFNQVTAGMLLVGDALSGGVTVSDAVNPANTNTLRLQSGAGISQTGAGAITEQNLAIIAAGAVALGTNSNSVDTLAVSAGGNIDFKEANGLSVGTVGGVNGVSTNSGSINITAVLGSIVVTNTPATNDISATTGVTLTQQDTGNVYFSISNSADVKSTGGNIAVTANDMTIGGTITAPAASTVSLLPNAAGETVILGTEPATANTLELTDAELNRVSAGTIQIGSGTSGAIAVGAVLSPFSYKTLSLTGATTFNAAGGLTLDVTSATVYEKVQVNGAVSINPAAALTVNSTYNAAVADVFTLIENTSGGTTTGTFSGKPEGSIVPVGTQNKGLTYIGGTGANDVQLFGAGGSVSAVLAGGTLTIADTDATGKNNQITITLSGTDLVITDVAEQFQAAPAGGTLSNGNKTLTIPVASITAGLIINGAGGNDTLTVNLTTGDAVPTGNLTFNGGVGGDDGLTIQGGNQGTVTYGYTSGTVGDGSIAMSAFGTVNYTGLEPITNTGTASDIIFNLPAGPNAVTLGDDGVSNTLSRLSGATFELTDFANPTGSVTINRGNVADTITINALPDFNASLTVGASGVPVNVITVAAALTLGSATSNGNLTLFGGTNNLNANINTDAGTNSGNISVTGATVLGANVTLDTDGGGTDGTISFSAGINALNSDTQTLAVTAGGGNVSLSTIGGSVRPASLTINSAANVTATGGLTLGPSGITQVAGSGTSTFANLTTSGGGPISLTGTNFTLGGTLTTTSGGNISLTHTGPGSLTAGVIALGSSAKLTVNGTTAATTGTISGNITGGSSTAAVQKDGAGTLTLSGTASTYTGSTTINNGVLSITQGAATGVTSSVAVNNAGVFEINNITHDRPVSLNAGGTLRGVGAAAVENGVITVANGAVTLASGATATDTLTLGNAANDLTGGGAASVVNVAGAGKVVLSQTSDLSSAAKWVVGSGATLELASGVIASALGAAPASAVANYLTLDGGTLRATNILLGSVRGITLGAGGGTFNNYSGSGNFQVDGVISGTSLTISNSGSGLYVPNALNTYSGGTTLLTGVAVPLISSSGGVGPFGTGTLTFNGGGIRSTTSAAISVHNNVAIAANLTIPSSGTAANDKTLTLTGAVTLQGGTRTITVSTTNAAAPLILSGAVGENTAGSGLSKAGSGVLQLTGANTYTGTTTISAGTLQIGAGGTVGTLGTGAVVNSGTLTFNRSDAPTIANNISGTGAVNFNGTGVSTQSDYSLTGTNTWTGAVSVTNARVRANSVARLGSGAITVNAGGQVYAFGGGPFNQSITLNGTGWLEAAGRLGALRLDAGQTWSGGITIGAGGARISAYNGSGTISGNISGGALEVGANLNVSEQLTLSGTNNYTTTLVNQRVRLAAGSSNNLGSGTITVNSSGQLYATGAATYTKSLILNGIGWNEGAGDLGALRLQGGTWSGDITLASNSRITNYGGSGTVTGALSGAFELELGPNQNVAQLLTLTPSSNVTAATRVTGANTVVVAGNTNAFSSGDLTINGGTLRTNGNNFAFSSLAGTAGTLQNGHASTASTVTVGSAGTSTSYSALLSDGGAAALNLTKTGSGALTLGSANSYTGATSIGGGVLIASVFANGGAASSIGQSANAATNLVLNGGTLQYTGGAVSTDRLFSVGTAGGTLDLSGSGAVNFTNTGALGFNGATGARTLTITGSNTGANTIAAVIGDNTGATSVIKTGAGTISLTGANTYTGATTISNGTLLVNGSVANSAVTVQSGATLGGTGTTGLLTINSGAFHKPGNSPGLTTVNGNYIENGTLEIEFGGNGGVAGTDYDQVKVIGGGSVTLGASSLLSVPAYLGTAGTFNPTFGQIFTIIDNDGSGPGDLTGTFSNAAAGTAFTVDGKTLKVYYAGNDGNDVVLVSQNGTPSTLYVNDEFLVANATVDGDGETAGLQAAFVGLNAFATVADALTAYPSFAGVIYVNGGYSNTALLAGGGAVTLRMIRDLNNAENDVTLTNVSGDATDAIATQFFAATALLTIQQGAFAGVISGAGGLAKTTAGTLTLNGTVANSYSGGTAVNAGVLSLGTGGTGPVTSHPDALGSGAVTINAGGRLQLWLKNDASYTLDDTIILNGGTLHAEDGNYTLTGAVSVPASSTLSARYSGKDLAIGSVITGAGGLTIQNVNGNSSGSVIFTNKNTYTGGTTVSDGVLRLRSTANNGLSTIGVGNLNINANGVVIAETGDNQFGSNVAANIPNVFINGGTLTASSPFAGGMWFKGITMTGGTINGSTGLNPQNSVSSSLTTLASSSTATVSAPITNAMTNFQVNVADGTAATDLTLSSVVSGGASTGFTKAGAGLVNQTGTWHNFAGTLTIGGGTFNTGATNLFTAGHGTAKQNTFSVIVDAATWTNTNGAVNRLGNVTLRNGATWNLTGASTDWGTYFLAPLSDGSEATLTVSGSSASLINGTGNLRLGPNPTFSVADVTSSAAADLTVSVPLENQTNAQAFAAAGLTKTGAGTLTLTGANTYSGTTTISGGVLQVGAGSTSGTLGTGAVTNNAALVFNRSDAIAVANVISGTGSLTQAGSGTLNLTSTTSSYSGTTIFAAGIVNVASISDYGVNSSLGNRAADAAGNVGLLFRGGTLQYTGSTAQSTNRAIRISTTGGATIDASGSGAGTLSFTAASSPDFFENSGARTLTLTGSNTGGNTFAMKVSEAGGKTTFRKLSTGTWFVTNNTNDYTGETIIGGGVLNVSSVSDYGVASAIGSRALADENNGVTGIGLHFTGGTLQYTGATPQSTNRQIRMLNGNGATIDASGSVPSATLSFTFTGNNINLFDTAGARTLTLTGTNTGANLFGITLNDQGTNPTNLVKNQVGSWTYGGSADGTVFNGSSDANNRGTITVNAGVLTMTGKNNARIANVSNQTVVNGGATLQLVANAGNTTAGTSVVLSSEQTAGQPLIINNNGALSLRSDSDVTFAGGNNFGGLGGAAVTIDVNQLTPGNTNKILGFAPGGFATANTTINVTGGNGYTLATGAVTTANNSALTLNAGTANLSMTSIASVVGLTVNGASNTLISGVISNGSSASTLQKNGTGTLTLAGANTYSGVTTVSAGTLQVGNAGASGTLGSGGVTNNATLAFNRTDTVTVANNITGTGVINHLGTGTTNLTGANTAGGGTNITSGRLNINNTLGSNVTVTSPGVLGGSGTITGNVSGNGTVAPGNSPGILTINGAFTPTGTIQYEVNSPWTTPGTDFDLINVNGTANLSGATLQFVNTLDASAPTALSVRTILANDGVDPTTPSANPAQGATVTIGSRTFKIYYNGGDGNDVVLVEAAQPTIVYVDDAWNNYTSGTIIVDADPIAAGNQQGVYGVNAFSGVNANFLFADAFNAVAVAGTVVVNAGDYSAQTVNINKQLTLNAQENAISFGTLDDSVTNATLNLNGITLTVGALNTSTQFDSVIAGTGSLVKTGTGTLTLAGTNTFGGQTTIGNGTIRLGNNSALGDEVGKTVIQSGATLDVGGFRAGATGNELVEVVGAGFGGGGAIINSGAQQFSAFRRVTLTGATTFAGPNRWDLRDTGGASTLDMGGFTLTKAGTVDFDLVNTTISNPGDVVVNGGNFYLEGTTQFNGPGKMISLATNAVLHFWNNAQTHTANVNMATGSALAASSGGGPTLSSGSVITLASGSQTITTNNNIVIAGQVTGAGSFTKNGTGNLTLSNNANNYSGSTTVSAGTLIATQSNALGTTAGGTTVANGATLRFDGPLTNSEAFVVSGAGVASTGAIFAAAGANTLNGTITAVGDTTINNTGGLLTLNGNTALSTGHLTIAGSGNTTVNGAINSTAYATNSIGNLSSLSTGLYSFTGASQTFNGYVDNVSGTGWLLVGRGREGWQMDNDGQGAIAAVSQNLGTTAAFAPAYYSDAIINDLLAQSGLNNTNVEIRLKRAANTTGTSYQESRFRNFAGTNFTFDLDAGSGIPATWEVFASTIGGAFGPATSNTRDTNPPAGNDATRVFTWAWSGHNNQQGFSYGQSISGVDNNSPTTFLWEATTENHAIPYTEVYIRSLTAPPAGGNDVIKTGAGTLALNGANTYSGDTIISGGLVTTSTGANIPDTSNVTLAAQVGGGLTLGANETVGAIAGGGPEGGNVNLGAFTLTTNASVDTTFIGQITGTGGLNKNGAGTLTLGGVGNTFSGPVNINQGGISLLQASVPTGAAGYYSYDSVSGATVNNQGTLGATKNGTLAGGATTTTGLVGNAMSIPSQSALMQIALTGAPSKGIDLAGGVWTASAWFNTLYSTASFRTLFRGATNDHQVIINNGTTNLGLYDNATGGNFRPSGFDMAVGNGPSAVSSVLSGWHQITAVGSGTNAQMYIDGVFVGTTDRGSVADIYSVGNHTTGTQAFAQKIDEVYIYQSALTAAQVLDLYRGSFFSATTNLLPDAGTITVAAGASLNLNGRSETIGALAGGGSVTNGNATSSTLTAGGNNASTTFSGVMSNGVGTLTFVKNGTGSQTLSGANTYTGTTTVNDGTLIVAGSLANGPAATDVVVNDTVGGAATVLSGVGTINGAVQMNSGTIVAPGATPTVGVIGTLIVNNNFTFTPGSTYQVDITPPGSSDKLQVSGLITLGNATLSVTSSGNLSNAVQQTFNIIDNTGSTPVSGIFNGLAEGSTVTVNGSTVPAFITYNGGTGNSIGVDVNLNTQPVIDGTNGNDILVIRQVAGDPTQYQFSLNAAAFVNVPAGLPFTFNAGDGTDILVVDLVNGPVAPVGGLFFNGNNGADIFSLKGTNTQTATYTPSAATLGQSTVTVGAGSYSIFTTEEVDLFGLAVANFVLGAVANSVAVANTTGTNASANIPPNAHPTVSTAAALGLTGTTNGIAFSDLKLWSIGTFNLNSSTGADTLTLNSGNNTHAVANVNINTQTGVDSFTALGELSVSGNVTVATQNIAFNGGVITTPLAQQVSLNAGTGAITTNSAARDVATGDLTATAAGAITLNVETATIQASSTTSGDITLTEETSVNLVSVTTAGGNVSVTANNSLTATSVVAGGSGFNATLTATTGNAVIGDVTAAGDVVTINAPLGTITDLDNTAANDITANTINLTSGLGVGAAGVNGSLEVSAATAQTVNASATTSGGIFLNNLAGAVNFNNIVASGVGAIELRSIANTTLTNVVAANGRIDAFTAQTSGAATNVLSVVSSTDNDANDITIIATTGELNITTVNAGSTSGDVILQSVAGGINDDGANATRITADDLTLTAAGDVGNSGASAELDTTVNTLVATSNTSITSATDLDADGVWINEANGLTIRAAGVIAGANGLVSIDVDAGALTTNGVVTAGGSGTVLLNADAGAVTLNAIVSSTSGAITVNGDSVAQNANITTGSAANIAVTADVGGIVMANGTNATTGSGTVSYSAANGVAIGLLSTTGSVLVVADSDTNASGGITDANGAANNVVATNAILTAATGIGSADALETVVSNLAASNSNSGAINIDNLQTTGLTIAGLTVLATTVNGVTNGGSGAVNITNTGAIAVNTPVAAGGPIFLHAIEAAGAGQNMTVAANITSTANTVTLTAGDDFTLQATQAISGTSVTVNTDADNAGSTVLLAGSATATAGNVTLNTAGGIDNVTLTGSLTANNSGNITINLGGGNDVFDANTPTTGTLSAVGGVITVNAGNGADIIRLGGNTRTAAVTALNTVLQGLDSTAAENPDGADQFFIRALSTTPFEVEGDDPTLPAGDVLNLDMTGALGPATVSHGIPNTTVSFFGGPLAVTYREIETYIHSGGVTNDIFDLNNFPTGNVFDVQLLDVNTLQVQLDGVPVWTSPDDQVNSLTFAGRAASADAVRVHGMAGTGQLPTEAGGLLGQTVFAAVTYPLPTISNVRKAVSGTFTANSRSLPNNTNAPAFYYDGRGDSSNSGGDAIVLDLPTARNVAYLPDSSQPAAGDLSVQATGAPFVGFAATFRNVANLNLREQVAAGSSLLIDASSSDATANFILTDIADPAPANPNSPTDPVNLPGATQIAADTNLARTRFGAFQTVTVRSGNGADLIDLISIDPLGLTSVTLDSDNTASTDAAADTVRVRSVAATVTGGVTLLGGAGNDTLQIFDAVPTSKNVATQVVVNGEGGTDSLQINDSGSAIADTTLVYEDRIQGITNFSGADDVTWTGLETLTVNTSAAADTITVDMDNVDNELTLATIDGSAQDDLFLLNGVRNLTTLNLLGNTGSDTFGQNAPLPAAKIVPSTPAPPMTATVIVISGETSTATPGATSALVNPSNPAAGPDRLNIDISSVSSLGEVVDTGTGQVLSLGATPTHAPLYFNGIEDIDLYNDSILTDAAIGDLYVVGAAGDVNETFIYSKGFTNANDVNLRYQNLRTYGPFRPTTRIFNRGYGGNDQMEYNFTINPLGPAVFAEFRGDTGNDTLAAGASNDLLVGGAGNDTLRGGAGNDILWGDVESTIANGLSRQGNQVGDGNDSLLGQDGDDIIFGGGGTDNLQGALGNDYLHGGWGNDTITGGSGVDMLRGEGGDDNLSGDGDSDIVLGGAGNDRIWGRAARDIMVGGDGVDILSDDDASAEDMTVADITAYDLDTVVSGTAEGANDVIWRAILSAWVNTDPIATRRTGIISGTYPGLAGNPFGVTQTSDDGDTDTVIGQISLPDWILLSPTDGRMNVDAADYIN